jgi:hypothetical protein
MDMNWEGKLLPLCHHPLPKDHTCPSWRKVTVREQPGQRGMPLMTLHPTISAFLSTASFGNFLGFFIYLFFWWDWGLNSGLCACKVGSLLLEPHL